MTVTRLGQATAEFQTLDEIVLKDTPGPTISATKVRTGSYAFRFIANNEAAGLTFASSTVLRAGMHLNHEGLASASAKAGIFLWDGSATDDGIIWNAATDDLELYANGTLADSVDAASTGFTTQDTWMQIALFCTLSVSAGEVSFYINGTRWLHGTSLNTGATLSGLYFGGRIGSFGAHTNTFIDDFYVDAVPGEPTAAPSDRRFGVKTVNGDGGSSQFTVVGASNNWEAVDDGVPDDDTTHVYADASDLRDLYTTTGFTIPPGFSTVAYIPSALSKKTDGGTDSQLEMVIKDGANETVSAGKALTTDYRVVWHRFDKQPDGTSNWNQTALDSVETGIESAGSF